LGKSIFDLIHPDFHQITRVRIKRVADEGLSVPVTEMRYLRLDGTPIDVEIQAISIIYDGAQANLVAIRDISARKRAEQALREEEYLLKQLASFTEELLKTGPEQITYQKILKNLLTISKAKYGAFTLLNESRGKFTTVAVAGLQGSVKNITQILGFDPVGKEWNEYSTENEQLKGKVVARFASMSALAGIVIPEIISKTLEKLLNMGEVTVTKVIVNNQMIGDFTLIMPAGKQFE
ncbi:MAG: PAS domain S-box protein, partial [Chloroflexi bacterium]|nr:PAS domain S-box protein [Chloroflexota bacterium]